MRFVYPVDLTCSKCRGPMRIISSIEAPSVIKPILNHLGIWLIGSRPSTKIFAHQHYLNPNPLVITLSQIKTHTAAPTPTTPGMYTYTRKAS